MRVRVGVASQKIVVRAMELPVVSDPGELDTAVRFQAADQIPMPMDSAVLDHVPLDVVDSGAGPRQRVLLVAARRDMIERILAAVHRAGLRPEGIDLAAFAMVRALHRDHHDEHVLYLAVGGLTNLAVAEGTTCLFTRPLSAEWDSVDDNVASGLAEEIRLSIDFYMAQPEARWVGEVVLSGPGARRGGLADQLGGMIDVPVTVAEPLGRLGENSIHPDEDAYRHTIAAGLALGSAS